jgi:hypothetical protein
MPTKQANLKRPTSRGAKRKPQKRTSFSGRLGLIKLSFSRKWLILFAAIIGVVGALLIFKSFAATTPYTVEAETMTLSGQSVVDDAKATGAKAVSFSINGSAITTVNLTAPATSFSIKARGDQCKGAPQVQVKIDSNVVTTLSVTGTTYGAYGYSLPSPLASGAHALSLSFTNDYTYTHQNARKNCNRNVYIDSVTFNLEVPVTPTPPPAPVPATSAKPAGRIRMMIDSNPDQNNLTVSAQQNDFVVIQPWRKGLRDKLKAANPKVKVLAYLNVGGINSFQDQNVDGMQFISPHGYSSSGVHWDDAAQAGTARNLGTASPQTAQNGPRPYLFLHSVATGLPFSFGAYDYIYAGNVGHPEYQALWKQRALQLISEGWDGIFADDTNMSMRHHHSVSDVKEYPTDSAYNTAVKNFATAVFPAVKQAGGVVIPNLTGTWAELYPDIADQVALAGSGGFSEFDGRWWPSSIDTGYQYESLWTRARQSQKLMEDNGRYYLSLTPAYGTADERAAKFSYASLLLYGNGYSFGGSQPDYKVDTTNFGFANIAIGTSAGAAVHDTSGIWKREFSGAIVIVNPTSTTRTIDLSMYGLGTRTLGTFTADVIAR